MDAVIERMAAAYDEATQAGQAVIKERWRFLQERTKTALRCCYSEAGRRQAPEDETHGQQQAVDDVERIEFALGTLKRCAGAKLPSRKDRGATVPAEALTDEVLSACETLVAMPLGQDPDFLRLALIGLAAHQEAYFLTIVPAEKSSSPALAALGMLFKGLLALCAPWALAAGIAAAGRQDVAGAAISFYLAAFGVFAWFPLKPKVAPDPDLERAYLGWVTFRYQRQFGVAGAGALKHLSEMLHSGIRVPAIAFDVAETLRAKATAELA